MYGENCVIVTLATGKYLTWAKQLFSSIYFNTLWNGDYLLLTSEEQFVEEFVQKHILVKRIFPYIQEWANTRNHILSSKMCLFSDEFKKWDHVIFIDSDCMVVGDIQLLLDVKRLGAISGKFAPYIKSRFEKKYKPYISPTSPSFNGGLFSIKTSILGDGMDMRMIKKFDQSKHVFKAQTIENLLNFYFEDEWEELPGIYNLFHIRENQNILKSSDVRVIHFIGDQLSNPKLPSLKENLLKEWKTNLHKFSKIRSIKNRPKIYI